MICGDVGVDVGEGQLPALAVGGHRLVDLGLEVGLGVGGVAPELLLQALVGRGTARERGQLAAPDVPEDVHQPQPVLGGRVARAELGAVAGGARDVRHTGLLVADDRDVGAACRVQGGGDLVGGDAEGGVVEEGVDRGVGEARVAGGQVVVGAELVARVLRHGAEALVEEDLGEGGVAVLPGRQDVGALAAAVVRHRCRLDGVGVGVGGRGRGSWGKRRQKTGNECAYGGGLEELRESTGSSHSVRCVA